MSNETKQNEKGIEVGKVFTRDDNLDLPDPANGDAPLLSPDEQKLPVEVELIRPIEVNGVETTRIVIDPSTISTEMMIRHQQQKGTDALKTLRWVCECTRLAEADIKKMLPADYRRVATAVGAFT